MAGTTPLSQRPEHAKWMGRKGPEGSVARPLRRPLNSLLLPGGFNRVLFE